MNTHFAVAAHILVALEAMRKNKPNTPMPTAALSWSAQTHKVFILRIVKKIEEYGLVNTIRGPKGGIILTRPGSEISLEDVFLATKDNDNIYKIHSTNDRCQIGNNVIDVLATYQKELDTILLQKLSEITIAQLVDQTLHKSEIKLAEGVFYTNFRIDPENTLDPHD